VSIFYIHSDPLNAPRQVTRPSDNVAMWTWNSDPFGTDAANPNPAGAGAFAYNLRFPGQVFDGQAGLHQNRFRDYDPASARYVESDPLGLPGGINTYNYARGNSEWWIDPSGLEACPGGQWSQDFGDMQVSFAFGGYISTGRVNYTCRTNTSTKCSGNVTCIGGGVIAGAGIAWNLYGYAVGAPNTKDLEGWSGWQVAGSLGPFGVQAPEGGGVSVSAGISLGAGFAAIKCYTRALRCTSGCSK
jgi:RHS repeat-associated protein